MDKKEQEIGQKLSVSDKKKIDTMLSELAETEIKAKIYEQKKTNLRKIALKTFEAFDIDKYEITKVREAKKKEEADGIDIVTFTLVKPSSIIYDIDAVVSNVDKELYKRFIETTYFLNDVEEFKKMLKRYKVPSKDIKKFIAKDRRISEARLKKLYEIGEISVEDLAGCYTISDSTPYIRLNFTSKEF